MGNGHPFSKEKKEGGKRERGERSESQCLFLLFVLVLCLVLYDRFFFLFVLGFCFVFVLFVFGFLETVKKKKGRRLSHFWCFLLTDS